MTNHGSQTAAVERERQIVIEGCLDIGRHEIPRGGLRRPGDYREVFTVLHESGIVETEPRSVDNTASFWNRTTNEGLGAQYRSIAKPKA